MRKILLDGKEVKSLVTNNLPMLIHGKENSGASLYTISLASKWFSQGCEVLFLCGYQMAEQEFAIQVGADHPNAKFYTKDKIDEFVTELKNSYSKNVVIFVKNIELFDEKVFDTIFAFKKVIVSGDIDQVNFKHKLLSNKFTTKIYFSDLGGESLPPIQKYHGFVITSESKGVTWLE